MNSEDFSRLSFKERYLTAKNLTYFAILLALVIVLQLFGSSIRIGVTQLSFVLVPIVLCGMILGPFWAGALGFIFGLIVYLQGLFGVDVFTLTLINDHPLITALTCLVKGVCSGIVSGFTYKIANKNSKTIASFLSAGICPIVNTGLFIIGALFMSDTLSNNFVEDGSTVIYYLIIGCAGVNFLVELAINLICAPAILRITKIVEKNIRRKG